MLRVGVVSEAMDGAASELNPGWVHRQINTFLEVRHVPEYAAAKKSYKHHACESALSKQLIANIAHALGVLISPYRLK